MKYIFTFMCMSLLLYSEPSAFELQSGSTKKDMKELKENSLLTQSVITDFQLKITNLTQSLEGLKTLYEGLSTVVKNDSLTLKNQVEKIKMFEKTLQSYYSAQSAQADLISSLKTQIDLNSTNIAKIEEKIDKSNKAFSDINNEIVVQVEAIAAQVNLLQSTLQDQIDKNISKDTSPSQPAVKESSSLDFSNKKPKDIFKDAKTLFRQKHFDKSRQHFEYLVNAKKYLAESNYYLGEIYYAKKDYNNALAHFKISISHNENTSYMPILLWHTAWSFKYLKDQENYQKFLNSLIELYPNSEQASKAKNLLNKK